MTRLSVPLPRIPAYITALMERAGEELPALRVVQGMLEKRLADALRDAAVDLPLDDHVVDDAADVVDAHDAGDGDFTGLGIDFGLADLRSVRPGRRGGRLGRR